MTQGANCPIRSSPPITWPLSDWDFPFPEPAWVWVPCHFESFMPCPDLTVAISPKVPKERGNAKRQKLPSASENMLITKKFYFALHTSIAGFTYSGSNSLSLLELPIDSMYHSPRPGGLLRFLISHCQRLIRPSELVVRIT